MAEDCYFFIDFMQPEEKRCMSILCVECHDKYMPDTGWLWKGSQDGYGPFDYQCHKCNRYIHKTDEEENCEED